MEEVILVDSLDNAIGTMEKMEAHYKGVLHRAFSVLLFNDQGEILLQKRADSKYHSKGLWTNTCCSHPKPGESVEEAATRRLQEEMGINTTPSFAFKFIYKTDLENNLQEHELDHVLIGQFNQAPRINQVEVSDWRYVSLEKLREEINKNPSEFTFWFKEILNHPAFNAVMEAAN